MKNKNKCPDITKCTYPHCSCMPMMFCKAKGSDEVQQEKIDFGDLMELGFDRKQEYDTVWYNQLGYHYFIVDKRITSFIVEMNGNLDKQNIVAEWDVEKRTVRIFRERDSTGDILGERPIRNLDELKSAIKFFGGK